MKRIVDGKLYDTEKAELVVSFSSKRKVSTIFGTLDRWVECGLYKTTKGNWFSVTGLDVSGTMLEPLSENEAMWVIQTVEPAMYMNLFPDKVEEA